MRDPLNGELGRPLALAPRDYDPINALVRQTCNKIAVALAADAPRVENGTERYLIDAHGQTVFS